MSDLATMRPVHVGLRAPRLEDDRLLAGRARYVADLAPIGVVEVAFVRSQFAHARIRVDLSEARASGGVVRVVAGEDLTNIQTMPEFVTWAQPVGRSVLATDRVRYVGAPIAAVAATDRYAAEDAAELVRVDYDPLPAVVSIEQALASNAPRLYDEWPDNQQVVVLAQDEATDRAFADAAHVVRGRYVIQRHGAVPLETRGCLAEYRDGRLTLWSSTQIPHWVRSVISAMLPIAECDVRVVVPDVGGSFGGKWHVYPEEVLVSWLAMELGRPVRWIEDRSEHMVASCHARDAVYELEAATDERGVIKAVRGRCLQDVGSAEIYPVGFGPSFTGVGVLTGPYRIPRVKVDVVVVATNKTPSGAYRGYGLPESQFAMERLISRCARGAGADPFDLRREMLLRPEELPYTTPTGAIYDSGSYVDAFDDVVSRTKFALEQARQRYAEDPALAVGMAVSNFVEGTGATAFGDTGQWCTQDSVTLRFDPDGSLTVSSGVSTTGQGVPSMLTTLAADALGVPVEHIRVVIGDTDATPYGLGGWASRSAVVATGAMERAAATVREKAVRIAAHRLEASVEDVVLDSHGFHVAGSPDRALTWRDVAKVAYNRTPDLPPGEDPGLEATATYFPPGVDHEPSQDGRMNASPTYANGSVGAVVKVDTETGFVEVLDYLVAHDCGTLINPVIVDGQIQGGVAQGIGGALLEEMPYDENGVPLATTFMDYLLPSATEVPLMHVRHFESPSPFTAKGVKGAGEAGVIGVAAVIAEAIEDALARAGRPMDEEITATPIRPNSIWRRLAAGPSP